MVCTGADEDVAVKQDGYRGLYSKAGMVLNLSPIVVVETDDIAHIFVLFVSMILHRTVCCYASSALKTHVYTFPTSKLNKDTLT